MSYKRDVNHQRGKFIVYCDSVNLFKSCFKDYGTMKAGRVRKFPLPKIALLYVFLKYLLERENISDEQFRRCARAINNLINNSLNAEMSESEERNNGKRFARMLTQADYILLNVKISNLDEVGFNSHQLKEEAEKFLWTEQNSSLSESLFELEDHPLLYGQIGIVGLDEQEYFSKFNAQKMEHQKILLPVDEIGEPDWNTLKSLCGLKKVCC